MFRVKEKYLKPQTLFLIKSITLNKSRKGLSFKAAQSFTNHTHVHITPKRSLTPSSNKKKRFDRSLLPNPRVYYAGVLKKFHPRKKQATALCPFHKQSKPSFSVNLKYGKFFCFSCGISGRDIIDFHQRLYGINFAKAINELGGSKHE
ncbi:MAG: CHC2 zinc finger domain-containing protein [Candidatus Rickettsiella isopodorum]|jgi:hypothetical protein